MTDPRQLTVTVNADHQHIVSLESVDMPVPADDEVVVEVQATPVNPSDLAVLYGAADLSTARVETVDGRPAMVSEGRTGWGQQLAGMVGQRVFPGNEGAGTVVAAGASKAAQDLLGRVVTMVGGQMFRTHRLVKARQVVPLPEGAPAAEGASLFVNPMTVQGFLHTMEHEGHTALIHTAGASSLGQMLARLCVEREVPLVAVVRSARQRSILEELGLTHVVDSSEPDFMEALVAAAHATGATVAFDAIGGGTMADTLLRAMEQAQLRAGQVPSVYGTPVHKQVYIYGRLDQRPTTLSAGLGFYWGVGAWLLTPRLQQLGGAGVLKMRQYAIAERNGIFASHYSRTVGLDALLDPETARAIDRKATGQKFLVDPSRS